MDRSDYIHYTELQHRWKHESFRHDVENLMSNCWLAIYTITSLIHPLVPYQSDVVGIRLPLSLAGAFEDRIVGIGRIGGNIRDRTRTKIIRPLELAFNTGDTLSMIEQLDPWCITFTNDEADR